MRIIYFDASDPPSIEVTPNYVIAIILKAYDDCFLYSNTSIKSFVMSSQEFALLAKELTARDGQRIAKDTRVRPAYVPEPIVNFTEDILSGVFIGNGGTIYGVPINVVKGHS